MVDQVGLYYSAPLKSYRGFSQVDLTPPHHFQHGGGFIDQALGGYGDRGGDITGSIWESVLPASSIVLCGKYAPLLPLSRTFPGSFGHSDRSVLLGSIKDQHEKTVGMTCQLCLMDVRHLETA